jgi:hypothetical protein
MLIMELDSLNDKYYLETMAACSTLVDLKVAVVKHDIVLDSKIEEFTRNIGALDGNCEVLKNENHSIE